MQRYNDTNTPMIALVGFVGAILLLAMILGLQVLYYSYVERETLEKVVAVPTLESDSILAEQEIKLSQYGWLDRQTGRVAIPVQRAMELVVAELESLTDEERTDER